PDWVWTGLVLALALIARLALVFVKGPQAHFADTMEYDAAARSILAGHGVGENIPRAPLYPALLALGYAIFGVGNHLAIRLLQMPLAVGAVWVTMWLGERVAGRRAGLLAGVSAAVSPTLVYTASMLYPTALYTLILVAMTAGALRLSRSPGPAAGATLGALMALAWFTDQIVVVPAAAILAWIAGSGHRPRATLLRALALALIVTLAIVVPIARFQQRAHGTPAVFFAKAEFVLYAARHDSSAIGGHTVRDTSASFAPVSARAFIAREAGLLIRQPAAYLHDYLFEFVHFFNPYPDRIRTANRFTAAGARWLVAAFFILMLPCAFVGLVFGSGHGRERALLALVPLATAAVYALFFTQTRYRVPTEPMFLALAALGVERAVRRRLPDRAAAASPGPEPAFRA
ncbi:MAG TPA: glycosyltransferase family 39 protein, partial [Candidatus Eisenbacteria bacterium]